MIHLLNRGGPYQRADGTLVPTGGTFEPNEAELAQIEGRRIPGVWVPIEVPGEGSPAPAALDEASIDQYATGGGWYQLPDGRKVQGRSAAVKALNDPSAGSGEPDAEELDS
jgi:hypothetical protein